MKTLLRVCTVFISLLSGRCVAQNDGASTEPSTIIEKMPVYPGGDKALLNYIAHNVRYPSEAKENGITGVVNVSYIVTSEGRIDSVKVAKSAHPLLDAEAVRVVSTVTGYSPGLKFGTPVPIQMTVPIRFVLRNNNDGCVDGVAAFEAGVYGSAIEKLNRCINQGGDISEAVLVRAKCFMKTGDASAALKDLEFVVRSKGTWATEALMYRAKYHLGVNDVAAARADLDALLLRDSTSVEASVMRGTCNYTLRNNDAACADLERALRYDPKNMDALKTLGTVNMNSGRADKAIGYFTSAVAVGPNDSEVYYFRGMAHARNKNATAACADMLKARELGRKGMDSVIASICQ